MHAPPDEARLKQERRERFKREAKQPPPPLPVKRLAHPGGKIVSSDKDACLMKLIARKQAAGEELSDDQRRALQRLPNGAMSSARAAPTPPIEKVATKKAVEKPAPSSAISAPRDQTSEVSKRTRTLRKKMHEIAELERRAADGAVLQENQRSKLATKEAIAAELAQLEGADGKICAPGPSAPGAPVSKKQPCGCCGD